MQANPLCGCILGRRRSARFPAPSGRVRSAIRAAVAACLVLVVPLALAGGTDAAEAPDVVPAPEVVPAQPPAAAVAPRRILLLPVDFAARQMSAGGVVEPVPAWTEKSQQNIQRSLDGILGADPRFEQVPLPELDPGQQGLLREHIELFKVVAVDVNRVLLTGGKAWEDKRRDFDYTLGNGLRFLREATGADAALIIAGGQTTQSGGSVFMQLMIAGLTGAAAGGGGSFLVCGIVNLDDGRIEWFNSLLGAELFGMKSVDLRNAESAHKVLAGLFAPYPSSPLVGRRLF